MIGVAVTAVMVSAVVLLSGAAKAFPVAGPEEAAEVFLARGQTGSHIRL
jgi:hypothetical protein